MLKLRSWLLSFAFKSERLLWLGLAPKRWIQLSLGLLLIISFLYAARWLALTCVVAFLLQRFVYRWARKAGYTTFIPSAEPSESWAGETLATTEKVEIRGTGNFLLGDTERRLILVSGECWQLPIGEIALMLEAAPGHFAYQFIDPKSIEQVRFGHIWFGSNSEIAIEVQFQTDWIQADTQIKLGWQKDEDVFEKRGRRIVVLSFNEMASAQQLWDKLSM
ncbi:MAG: hypothetical protein ACI9EW_000425 [Cellvibrionaceae bacterium]|jgi:hypothetical protein